MEFFSRVQTQPFEGIISCPLSFLVWPSPSYWSLSLTLVPPSPHSAPPLSLCCFPSLCSLSRTQLSRPYFVPTPYSASSPSLRSLSLSLTLSPQPSLIPSLASSFSPSHSAPSLLLCSHLFPLFPLPAFFLPPSVSNVVYSAFHPITQTVYISVCLTVWLAAVMSVILYLYFGMYNTTWQPSLSVA